MPPPPFPKNPERAHELYARRCRTKHWVYLLRDPRNNEPKYVGLSLDTEKRFRRHLSKSHGKVRLWVEELKALGLEPLLEILEVVPGLHTDREQHFIREYGRGGTLLNRSNSYASWKRHQDHVKARWEKKRRRKEAAAIRRAARSIDAPRVRRTTAIYRPENRIEHNGLCMNQTQWAKQLGITRQALSLRLKKLPPAQALQPRIAQ